MQSHSQNHGTNLPSDSSKSGCCNGTSNFWRSSSPCWIHRARRELRWEDLPLGSFCRRNSASRFKFSRYQCKPVHFFDVLGCSDVHLESQPSFPPRRNRQCRHNAFQRSPPQCLSRFRTCSPKTSKDQARPLTHFKSNHLGKKNTYNKNKSLSSHTFANHEI